MSEPLHRPERPSFKADAACILSLLNQSRPHLALEKQCPIERLVMKHSAIVEIAVLGGLHHRYERVAA
jgi:hypothetical protein